MLQLDVLLNLGFVSWTFSTSDTIFGSVLFSLTV